MAHFSRRIAREGHCADSILPVGLKGDPDFRDDRFGFPRAGAGHGKDVAVAVRHAVLGRIETHELGCLGMRVGFGGCRRDGDCFIGS